MEWLLKVTDGPMKGAEVALVKGTRIKIGNGDACDIIISDATLADVAFELDVAEEAVSMILPDGTSRNMNSFDVHTFGTTSVAIGPADGAWGPLVPAKETQEETESPSKEDSEASEAAPTPETVDPGADDKQKGRHGFGCLVFAVLLLLLLLGLAWVFRGQIKERCPTCSSYIEKLESLLGCRDRESSTKIEKTLTLADIASQHGVELQEHDGSPVLKGNLRRRTERLAIRALALAANRNCRFDLSDDETLSSSANALLFTVTEGALKSNLATNRTVMIDGYAPTAEAYERVVNAMKDDVPWVTNVEPSSVQIGGPVPEWLRENAFATSGALGKKPSTVARMLVPTRNGQTVTASNTVVKAEQTSKASNADVENRLPRNMFPVAGILMRPYPCIVMQNGHRIVEGGQLGAYTVEKISANGLSLKLGDATAYWEP